MPHVVHTFNVDISKTGTVEELPDKAARVLIRTGRARLATDDEISAGRAADAQPADDQMPAGDAEPATPGPAPAPEPSTPTDTAATPPPELEAAAEPQPADGKVTAVPKATGKRTGTVATTGTPTDSPAK